MPDFFHPTPDTYTPDVCQGAGDVIEGMIDFGRDLTYELVGELLGLFIPF